MDPNQVVAFVNLALLADGRVQAQCNGPSPVLILGLLEQGKADLMRAWAEKARQQAIEVAPPGLAGRLGLNGKG